MSQGGDDGCAISRSLLRSSVVCFIFPSTSVNSPLPVLWEIHKHYANLQSQHGNTSPNLFSEYVHPLNPEFKLLSLVLERSVT